MILANNILYSRDANALHYANGNAGVLSSGNVVFGDGTNDGCVKGRGFEDFPGVAFDATPASDAKLDHADEKHFLPADIHGKPRTQKVSGAIAP
jgi:hypothetical protein